MAFNIPDKTFYPFKILLYIPVPWVYILNYLIGVLLQFTFPFHIFSDEKLIYVRISGIIIFVIGAFFAAWSLIIFHKAKTTTIPGKNSKLLVRKGPYRLSRNPMYVSLIFAYLGEAGFLAQIWPVIVLPLLFAYVNWVVIPLEESILRKDFGAEYEDYCSGVNRWL